jgi:3-oxoacyl-[acyl-carrier-protein] synthase II
MTTMAILGAGWLTAEGYGTLNSQLEHLFAPDETLSTAAKAGLFDRPVKNFGRLDRLSRITLAAVSLALKDAGIVSSPDCKQAIGIVGTNDQGSLETDIAYFRDFLENGRKLARANLFIYTLPSSPMGEAAIHFGLTGPLLYSAGPTPSAVSVMARAAEMVSGGESTLMLAGISCGDEALYAVIGPSREGAICRLDDLLRAVPHGADIAANVTILRNLKRGQIK